MTEQRLSLWRRLSGPVKVGLLFAAIAIALSLFGIFTNPDIPASPQSIVIATVISGLTWGLISWAIATAVVDVEEDVAARGGEPLDD